MKLSVLVPTYKDPFLNKTIKSILDNSVGEIEVIPILDGFTTEIMEDPRIRPIILRENIGMRNAINVGITAARGQYVMKCDSHCLFAKGFDDIMTSFMKPDWLLIPRRYSLNDTDNWIRDEARPTRDYHYLNFPSNNDKAYGLSMNTVDWKERDRDRHEYAIDETMTFQGSCWMADKGYYMERVGLLDDSPDTYGTFADEPQEIGLKYWLGGGKNMVIK